MAVRKKRNGFTFIEILLTMGIFSITTVALIGLLVSLAAMNESSRNTTRAMAHARLALEEVRNTAQTGGLGTVTATNWTTWWNNYAAANPGSLIEPGEVVQVHYVANPAPGNPAAPPAGPPDPLTVTIRVEWNERGRVRSGANGNAPLVTTLVTQR